MDGRCPRRGGASHPAETAGNGVVTLQEFDASTGQLTSGSINATFSYDAKGNLIAGNGLTVTYTASNKAKTITRGTATIAFDHDPEHQRFAQTGPSGVTLYLSGMGVLAERFGQLLGPQRWTNYLIVGGRLVGIHVEIAQLADQFDVHPNRITTWKAQLDCSTSNA